VVTYAPSSLPSLRNPASGRRATFQNSQETLRIVKKVRVAACVWRFVSLDRIGGRYVWDKHLVTIFSNGGRPEVPPQIAGETPNRHLRRSGARRMS